MAKFLSEEWIDALVSALNTSEQTRDAIKATELTIQQRVSGGPDGDVQYWTSFDHGRVEGGLGPGLDEAAADVTFAQDYATACELGRGEINPQSAFMQGKLTITGNMGKLLQHRSALEALGPAMAGIRTEY